jgi:hypothetical protein
MQNRLKTDLRKIGWVSTDWIQLAEDKYKWLALVHTVMNLRALQNVAKFQLHGIN